MKRTRRILLMMTMVFVLITLALTPAYALAAPFMDGAAAPPQDFNLLKVLYDYGILAAVGAVAISALMLAKAWIDAKVSLIKDDRGRKALGDVNNAVFAAVLETAQLYADKFKAAAAKGKLTEDEKAQLKDLAYNRAVSFISGDIWNVARKQVEDLNEYIRAQIEKYVRMDKQAIPVTALAEYTAAENTSDQ